MSEELLCNTTCLYDKLKELDLRLTKLVNMDTGTESKAEESECHQVTTALIQDLLCYARTFGMMLTMSDFTAIVNIATWWNVEIDESNYDAFEIHNDITTLTAILEGYQNEN